MSWPGLEQQTPAIGTDCTGNDFTTRWGDKVAAPVAALTSFRRRLVLNVILSQLAGIAGLSCARNRDAPYCSSDTHCCHKQTPAGKFCDHGQLLQIHPGTRGPARVFARQTVRARGLFRGLDGSGMWEIQAPPEMLNAWNKEAAIFVR
jgi:hypothetical protein